MVLVLALSMLGAGCDQAREHIAGLIRPATAGDVAATMREKNVERKFDDALAAGVRFLDRRDDTTGLVAWELSKACAQLGKRDEAIRYAQQAVGAHVVSADALMSEPMLEPVQTDPRLVALAAGIVPAAPAPNAPAAAEQQAEPKPQGARASIGANGVEASAGDVSVKLPD